MRIRHVIPTVGPSARPDLVEAQELTLKSIEIALRCADPAIHVDVRAAHFIDESLTYGCLSSSHILNRSIGDSSQFRVPRRLPLLSEVIEAFGSADEYDLAVLTNADIALQPLFYTLIAELAADGRDAFSITRRTVQPKFSGSSLAQLSVNRGTLHPGHDCFVIRNEIVAALTPCDTALGVRFVMRALTWQLQLLAENYEVLNGLHATFHVGDDRPWTSPTLSDYEEYNVKQLTSLAHLLRARFGTEAFSRLPTAASFVAAIEDGASIAPARQHRLATTSDIPQLSQPRLVFCATSGRSGSEFLAGLLGSGPMVDAGHERAPQMTGPFARRVAYEPLAQSYEDRLAKVDAVRVALGRLPANWIYADISHMFVKTYADVILDNFQHERISIVVLRRDPVAVAKSMFELDYFGLGNNFWKDWMIPPTARHSAFRLDRVEISDQFDLIFGYLVSIENRTAELRERSPGANWIDVRLENLVNPDGASDLFRRLGTEAPTPDRLAEITATPHNQKRGRKKKMGRRVSDEFLRQRLGEFLERHADRIDLNPFLDAHELR